MGVAATLQLLSKHEKPASGDASIRRCKSHRRRRYNQDPCHSHSKTERLTTSSVSHLEYFCSCRMNSSTPSRGAGQRLLLPLLHTSRLVSPALLCGCRSLFLLCYIFLGFPSHRSQLHITLISQIHTMFISCRRLLSLSPPFP